MSGEDEIAALAAEVSALRRTVETLADMLVRSGTINDVERRNLLRVARPSRGASTDDDSDDGEPPQPRRAIIGSTAGHRRSKARDARSVARH